MLNIFLQWIVPFICGSAVAFAGTMLVRLRSLKNGVQCLLRAEIIRQYEKWIEREFCPLYAKEALTKAYKAYHNLGGNDVATKLYSECMELPNDEGAR